MLLWIVLLFIPHGLKAYMSVIRRPSGVDNFSHVRLLLFNNWTKFIESVQELRGPCKVQNESETKRNETKQIETKQIETETKQIETETQDDSPGFWLADTFSTSSLQLPNIIQRNLIIDGKQVLHVLYHVFVFRADWKTNMTILASDWLMKLFLRKRWTEFNKT